MIEPVGTGGTDQAAYTPVGGPVRTFRVNNDGTLTPVVNITALSDVYGVQFTFTLLASTYDHGDAPPQIALRTGWVNAVCSYPHVVGFHTEADQGPDQVLYNYAVITVGPEGATAGDTVTVRMDHLGDPSTFAQIDAAWARQVAIGVT